MLIRMNTTVFGCNREAAKRGITIVLVMGAYVVIVPDTLNDQDVWLARRWGGTPLTGGGGKKRPPHYLENWACWQDGRGGVRKPLSRHTRPIPNISRLKPRVRLASGQALKYSIFTFLALGSIRRDAKELKLAQCAGITLKKDITSVRMSYWRKYRSRSYH